MRRVFLFLLAGVGLVLLFVLSAGLVLGRANPHTEIQSMLSRMSTLQSVYQKSGLNWTKEKGVEKETTTLLLEGPIQFGKNGISFDALFDYVKAKEQGGSFRLSGQIMRLGRSSYILYKTSVPKSIPYEGPGFMRIVDDAYDQFGPFIPGMNEPINIRKSLPRHWDGKALSGLRELFLRITLFEQAKYIGHEEISGEKAAIIEARMNPQKLEEFLSIFVKVKSGRDILPDEIVNAFTDAQFLSEFTIRFYIGQETKYLHRLHLIGVKRMKQDEAVFMDIRVDLSEFNQVEDIIAPNAKDFRQNQFGSLGGEVRRSIPQDNSQDFGVLPGGTTFPELTDIDKDGLEDHLEAFYGTDPLDDDTDDDGFTDGEEVHSGYNPNGPGSLFGFGLD